MTINMRPFQIVLIGVFIFLAIAGLVTLMLYNNSSHSQNPYGNSVTIWGTFSQNAFNDTFAQVLQNDHDFKVVKYVEKDPRTFDNDLTTAIANGNPPDLVVLPHTLLVKHRPQLLALSFSTIPERTFRDTYVDGAEIFLRNDGIYGIPLGVDPLVMYWNRDMFSSSGLAEPPKTWERLSATDVPKLTAKNTAFGLTKSAVALGEYDNVKHAKDILSMLLLQAGSTVVDEAAQGYNVTLGQGSNEALPPADATLSFYTQFALPSHPNYSWNRSLPEDHQQFLAGDLGIYFAPGSEYKAIQQENPNLNFDIAKVPQGADATNLRDFGTFYAFAIPKSSQNIQGAFKVASVLASQSVSTGLDALLNIAPVSRAELANGTSDPYRTVLYASALISRGWLDPDPTASDNIFKQMVDDVTSGRLKIHAAVGDAVGRLQLLFR
jgi:multiple sugar transport system substrate-binding protein